MTLLVDTCLIIDLLRDDPRAVTFFSDLDASPHISIVTLAGLRAGERGPKDKARIDHALSGLIWHVADAETAEIAGDFMRRYRRSHAIDMADALIAATARQHGLRLATLNVKHFPMLPGLAAAY